MLRPVEKMSRVFILLVDALSGKGLFCRTGRGYYAFRPVEKMSRVFILLVDALSGKGLFCRTGRGYYAF